MTKGYNRYLRYVTDTTVSRKINSDLSECKHRLKLFVRIGGKRINKFTDPMSIFFF